MFGEAFMSVVCRGEPINCKHMINEILKILLRELVKRKTRREPFVYLDLLDTCGEFLKRIFIVGDL